MNPLPSADESPTLTPGVLANNNQMVESLRQALSTGEHAYSLVPAAIRDVILDNAWRARQGRDSPEITYGPNEFETFLNDPPPKGLGVATNDVRRFLGDSTNPARVQFEGLIARRAGGINNPSGANQHTAPPIEVNPDNVRNDLAVESPPVIPFPQTAELPRDRSDEPQAGNSVGYAVRRLARERPDLLAKVESGELSANAAAVEAGFRKKPATLPDDPELAAARVLEHFQGERLEAFMAALVKRMERAKTPEAKPTPTQKPAPSVPMPARLDLIMIEIKCAKCGKRKSVEVPAREGDCRKDRVCDPCAKKLEDQFRNCWGPETESLADMIWLYLSQVTETPDDRCFDSVRARTLPEGGIERLENTIGRALRKVGRFAVFYDPAKAPEAPNDGGDWEPFIMCEFGDGLALEVFRLSHLDLANCLAEHSVAVAWNYKPDGSKRG